MSKVTALAGLAALLLAVVAAFVAIPNLNVAAALVGLGIVAGLTYAEDRVMAVLLATLVYPLVAVALTNIPVVGEKLGAIAGNVGMVAAGVAATVLAMRLFSIAKASVGALTGKA
jgi:hypothetical protein